MNNEEKYEVDIKKVNNLLNKLDPDNKIFNESNKIYEISKKYNESKDLNDLNNLYKMQSKNRQHIKK